MILRTRLACLMLAALFLLSAGAVTVDNASAAVPEPEWQEAAPLPYPIYLAASVQNDDYNLYIIGGRSSYSAPPTDSAVLYDLSTEETTVLANMPVGVSGGCAAIGLDGLIYVFGGLNYSLPNDFQAEVQIYDPSTDTWSLGAAMPEAVTFAEAVAMPDGLIYIMGGNNQTDVPNAIKDLVQIYDPVSDSWSSGPAMPMPLYSGVALAINEYTIWYMGGSNADISTSYDTIYGYNTQIGYWYASSWSLPEIMAGLDAVIGPDGQIYLIGGGRTNSAYGTSSFTSNTGYCFDLFYGGSSSIPDMPQDRKYHSVGFDEKGNVFVIGGYSFDEPTGETTANASKIQVMDLQLQVFPQMQELLTGEQVLVLADFNFAFAPFETITSQVCIRNSNGEVVAISELTANMEDGNPGYFWVDVPQGLPSGDYSIEFSQLRPSDFGCGDLCFDGFDLALEFTHSATTSELLDEQNQSMADLQEANDALAEDLADANDKLDAMATNLMIVMIIAIIAVIVAVVVLVLSLRKKA